MKYDINAIKIPGTLESLVSKGIELPDGVFPFKSEPMLEHEAEEDVVDVLKGRYAENILYYSEENTSFNKDHTKITLRNKKDSITYNIFTRIWFLIPKGD